MHGRLLRYWHTLRWLKPVQFYGRLWFRVSRPRPDLSDAPQPRTALTQWTCCVRAASMMGPQRMRFLGVERELATAGDWNRADWPKLWLYNAHYFDDLAADGATVRTEWHRALIARWIAENPPGQGNGWEPYPASLRIVNWIKWARTGNALTPKALHSLAVQTRFLRRRLEVHLLGNHLWANAKALVFAGAFFAGPEADKWRSKGLALLQRELAEQILPDGGHFERSPMYHAILLEDLLDLIQLARAYPDVSAQVNVAHWQAVATRMLRWLRVMSHPDGGIAFFNDAALGIAPDYAALRHYAESLGMRVDPAPLDAIEALPDSGYVRVQAGEVVLIADVGAIGPDYLPGHAHADTLSFELSLDGRRVLVNSGTSLYEAGAERLRQRGTAAHNTVIVDGTDSSEVWSSFRVARRARPLAVRCGREGDALWLEAAHDGYRRLRPAALHRRRWTLTSAALEVDDQVDSGAGRAVARFHFHPDVARGLGDDGGQALTWAVSAGVAHLAPATWHPHFGASVPTRVLVAPMQENSLVTRFRWS